MSAGKKYSHRFERAILCLLSEPTIEQAAQKTGIGTATLSRWLLREDFRAAYADARQRSFETALSRLQSLSNKAVDTLKKNLGCGKPSIETRCAEVILIHAKEAALMTNMIERLDVLETWMKKSGQIP